MSLGHFCAISDKMKIATFAMFMSESTKSKIDDTNSSCGNQRVTPYHF